MITEPATAGRPSRLGRQLYEGHNAWPMMLAIKFGIAYSVSRASAEQMRALELEDFNEQHKRKFPPAGSRLTPAHPGEEFMFKDYAPSAFRQVREHFGVSAADYILSLAGEHPLRELGNPGKSGSCFYLTHDSKYIIKTVSKKECKFLCAALPMYYTYVVSNDSTMLPRFFGLVRINLASGSKQRLVLMNNLLPERYRFERYDLKGSSLGRAATAKERSDPLGVRKDRDFEQKLRVPDDMLALLAEQLHKDSAWLEKLRVMDYSLLVGLNWPNRQSELELRPCADLDPSGPDTDDEPWEECQSIPAAVYQQYGPAAAHGIPGGPKKGRGGFYAVGPPGAFEPDGEIWQRLRPWIEVDGKSPENWFDQYPNCGGADGDGVGMEGGSRTPTGEDADELGDLSAQTDDSNDDEAIVKAIVKGPQKARSRLRSLAPGRPASALAGRRSNTVPPPLHSANTNGHGNGWTGGSLGPVRATTLGQSSNIARRTTASHLDNSDSDEDDPADLGQSSSVGGGGVLPGLFRPSSGGNVSGNGNRKSSFIPMPNLGKGVRGMGKGASAPVEVPRPSDVELRAAFLICEASMARRRAARQAGASSGAVGSPVKPVGGSSGRSKDVSVFQSDDGGFRCINGKGEAVRVYAGIIDILQQYNMRKQMEHAYKAARWYSEKDGISVVSPDKYALRFHTFILSKFAPLAGGPSASATLLAPALALGRAALGEDALLVRKNSQQVHQTDIDKAKALMGGKQPSPVPMRKPSTISVQGMPPVGDHSVATIVHSTRNDDEEVSHSSADEEPRSTGRSRGASLVRSRVTSNNSTTATSAERREARRSRPGGDGHPATNAPPPRSWGDNYPTTTA